MTTPTDFQRLEKVSRNLSKAWKTRMRGIFSIPLPSLQPQATYTAAALPQFFPPAPTLIQCRNARFPEELIHQAMPYRELIRNLHKI